MPRRVDVVRGEVLGAIAGLDEALAGQTRTTFSGPDEQAVCVASCGSNAPAS
jgi:hypothetical protein